MNETESVWEKKKKWKRKKNTEQKDTEQSL